ncbi:olfactomedin-4-like [Pelobates fuscus]|uniref:olfactomedin-4-like n=1 Tax=Pelobates fuscus TaxID=191477 RepID=UPI002FE4B084
MEELIFITSGYIETYTAIWAQWIHYYRDSGLLEASRLPQAFTSVGWRVQYSTGSLDENGVCHCTVILPDSTFPADRIEYLEIYNYNMSISVQQQITKINSYELMVTVYIEKLKDLTKRVEIMETGGLTYTELDFELVKLEIREMESLILELKISLNGSNAIVEALYVEIHNISILVNQLESYDKNNVLVIRREIVALQKRLQECQDHVNATPLPPVDIGSCEHGGLVNISKPFTVQLNWLGFSYKYGGWGKDSAMGANQQLHFLAPLQTDGRIMNMFRTYSSRDDLLLYKTHSEKSLSSNNYGQGGGVIMYNNYLYFNCYNSRNLCKLNLQNYVITRVALTDSTYNNRFSYFTTTWQDIDLAGDENGLWVIYSTEQNKGNFVISKLNENSFAIQKTWSTSQYKPAATNAFMVCGVLYATRALDTRTEEIFYMYDTKTGKGGHLSIRFNKMMENIQSLSYNPNDHKLYMYNDGYLVTYDLLFQPVAGEKPKI